MTAIMTIDSEASCLPKHGRSFPIEVGLSDLSGRWRSWLIRPHADWREWSWTAEAENLHGISREALHAEGLPAAVVLRELAEAAAGHWVAADNDLDAEWLKTLAWAARTAPPFKVHHTSILLDLWRPTTEAASEAMARANTLVADRHRAGVDAQWLAYVIAELADGRSAPEAAAKGWLRKLTSALQPQPA
jgi:hypothetical protein